MRFRTSIVTSCLGLAILAFAGTDVRAQGLGTLSGRDAVGLTDADVRLMNEAFTGVLESQKVGETKSWENPESGLAGTALLVETFELEGMTCGEVEHVYTAGKGKHRKFAAPLCKASDGTWKFAF